MKFNQKIPTYIILIKYILSYTSGYVVVKDVCSTGICYVFNTWL